MFLWQRDFFGKQVDPFPMEFNNLPGTSPYTFPAIRASLIDNADLCLQELNRVLGTNTHTAPTEIAFPWDNVDHQWSGALHFDTFQVEPSFN